MNNQFRNSGAYGTTSAQPYVVSDGDAPSKLERTQQEVDNVTNIMRQNMSKALERDAKLNVMDERAVELQIGAEQFQTTARKVQRKYWWKNIKMWIILAIVLIIVIVIIGVAIYFSIDKNDAKPVTPKPTK